MNIAWFTPFDSKSAIGQVSKLICEELTKSCKVDIYSPDQETINSTSLSIIKYKGLNFDIRRLNSYDFVVYNMGNYAGNHRDIWEVMQRYPGILIQHDQIMQNFFSQITLFSEYGGNPSLGEREYTKIMRACYGDDGEKAANAIYPSTFGDEKVRIWNSEAALAYPLLEPLLSRATAVFSHAAFFLENIKTKFYGPTGYAYLPYLPETDQINTSLPPEFNDNSRALVVSNGIVHPVKRIERVAEMLLANPEIAKRVRYVVIGGYGGPYGDYLLSLAEGPLKGCLYLLGYQPDDVMSAFLQKADFCINLRYPNSEVCSRSLIEQMANDNPVIVLNSGVFCEMPDDCVIKINLENEATDLLNAFIFLLDNKEKRLEIGQRAAEFTRLYCTPQSYVSSFLSFLERIPNTIASDRIVNDCVQINKKALSDLSFNQINEPWVVDTVWRELSKVSCAMPSKQPSSHNVIGVWLGFPYVVGLRREGITKFLLYMLLSLLEKYPIDCELWTYAINEEEVRISFEPLLMDELFENRVRVVTEKNYYDVLNVPRYKYNPSMVVNETLDNLSNVAREYSKASCFITAIVYLDNVIGTGKPLFIPVHDLSTQVHYDDFIIKDPLYKARIVDIRSRAENLSRSGAYMFSNSEYVRQSQVLTYISSINIAHTKVIYLPVNIPKNLNDNILTEKVIRKKFGLKKDYLFYPTQVRPYKNVSVLIEALSILRDRNIDVNLVLTGNPSDVLDVEMAINKYKLNSNIICLSNVLENELYSLYRYAVAAPVPTLFEGGFPWQACEALFMDTPLVLSDIPVVRERILFCGMSIENCGLKLINPHNPKECADAIEDILNNREMALLSQSTFKDRLLAYSWNEAAEIYYHMFFTE